MDCLNVAEVLLKTAVENPKKKLAIATIVTEMSCLLTTQAAAIKSHDNADPNDEIANVRWSPIYPTILSPDMEATETPIPVSAIKTPIVVGVHDRRFVMAITNSIFPILTKNLKIDMTNAILSKS
ncbi:hypothetical protein AA100600_1696 [Gluconobacter thailandicus F149-1 = NBRC 100600]|nr:hypothetical protein Gbfr_027_025 [Gluconobacter frateurii M-2]GBR60074.1 hypothetical protein AA100600_1696 [Gluconobacter thailandicus F149-1 = NBRC 100600]GEL88671.1 hypothetical protein GTH01_30290 [Gluconobacter thailandicus F149-1 = NBRC 100600]